MILALANRKGGVGKSTLAVHIASALYNRTDLKILLIDADDQHTIKEFDKGGVDVIYFSWQKEYDADIPVLRFKELIDESEEKYDLIIIDTPGKMEGNELPAVVSVADTLLIPLIGSRGDIASTLSFLKHVTPIANRKEEKGKKLQVLGVINKKDKSVEYRELDRLNNVLGMQVLKNGLKNKVRYKRDCSTLKQIVQATRIPDEFNNFYKELTNLLNIDD